MNYEQIDNIPKKYIKSKIKEFLKEDIPRRDITTDNIYNGNEIVEAQIQAGEQLIFCGKNIVMNTFDKSCVIKKISEDGKNHRENQIIGIVSGPATEILKKERVMLNLIQRLSSISTKTHRVAQKAKKHNIKILDTRKTTPGIRLFEKYAVKIGGGWNHRLDLSSGIMIKDNHIKAAGGIKKAIDKIRRKEKQFKIELEVDYYDQIEEGLKCSVDGFLLDNMRSEEIKKAVQLIKQKNKKIFVEASGGITEQSLHRYLKSGVDAISMGEITHSVPNIDIKLEII
ncbi:MAG: nicotinate-nucleotide diphosphorylase (carboxylating) [Candidatus Marinimicrobia bacterium]|nr:nicotinate-nucleotide diphosphorylase (carboxylating) [Candidatus Neomarinimicrobiota bacterium]|tara:strand:- start:3571 stop:4422 length:852 start_codon:yes stop_codon:yes gene_type:complete